MDHQFSPSLTDSTKCIHCKRGNRDHTIIAQCEACPKVGPCEICADMLLCASCYAAEMKAVRDYQAPELQEARLQAAKEKRQINDLLEKSNKIDQSIQLVTDIFNAKTVALIEIMRSIDSDEAIENKPYARAEFAVNRIKHLTSVIFEQKKALTEAENEQRAIQVYLNQMANELRQEERAKLKIQDISYQPQAPKSPKTKTSGAKKVGAKPKIDMTEINIWANKVGVPGNVIHMVMIQKNMNAEAAARDFARSIGKEI